MITVLPQIIKNQAFEEMRDIYVTDALQVLAGNTARFAGGSIMKTRYADAIGADPKKQLPKDTRSGQEIAADIIGRLGRKEGTG